MADVRSVTSKKKSGSAQRSDERRRAERRPEEDSGGRTITLTLPSVGGVATGAVNAALLPVAVAREVLPAKGGLPLYLGLGALGATEVLEWPVAVGIGVGYAVLRRTGPPAPDGRAAGAEGG